MTNLEFLAWLFYPQKPFTVSVEGDPAKGRYGYTPPEELNDDWNNYFCVSVVEPQRRLVENFRALHCLVVDDVGPKVEAKALERLLGPPHWIVETSPGNFQWGWRLSQPVTDLAVANGLVEALCRATGISDMAGVNRLVRLPVGRNWKPGIDGFRSKFVAPMPRSAIPVEHVIRALEAVPVVPELHNKPFLPPHEDPVVLALEEAGKRCEPKSRAGHYDVQCPWVADHTGGRDDGAVYIAPSGFKCHHGHCAGKTFADFRKTLGLTALLIDEAEEKAVLLRLMEETGSEVEGDARAPEADGASTVEADSPEGPPRPGGSLVFYTAERFTDGDAFIPLEDVGEHFPRRWLFQDVVPGCVPWVIYGPGGIGKSRLGLALCMSVATGLPFGDAFRPADENGAQVLFLSQEDDAPDMAWRFLTQLEVMAQRDSRWREPEYQRRLRENFHSADLPFAQSVDVKFKAAMRAFQKRYGSQRLIVYDPLTLFWDHSDAESDMFKAQGVARTFRTLIDISKAYCPVGETWSVGMLHHRNKEGTMYGSVMIEAQSRLVFSMERDENASQLGLNRATLTCKKVNGLDLTDRSIDLDMDATAAAMWPISDFVRMTPEQRVARLITQGTVDWTLTPTELKNVLYKRVEFGATRAERQKVVDRVFKKWGDATNGDLEIFGLRHGKYNRVIPMGADDE